MKTPSMFKHWWLSLLLLVLVACIGPEARGADDRLKVGFITVGPVSDWGYNYAHNQGRILMEGILSKDVQTIIVENIPESAEVERVMEKMIASGTKLIFPTSYSYLDPALLGPAVPSEVQKEARVVEEKIKQGEFVVFQGPLKDREGKERIAAGQHTDFEWMEKMDWFVEGIQGAIPQK